MGLAAALRAALGGARPWPGPVDGPWRAAEYAVIDVETTGLDLRRDEVVSLGVVLMHGARIGTERWYHVVRPERPIDPDAMKVHALTPDEVASAPPLAEVLDELRSLLHGRVVVAHAAWVERAFLDRALAQRRERLPLELVDTAALSRAAGVRSAGTHEPDLEQLARDLGLPVHTPHHALGDALTTAQVLMVLATRLEAAARDAHAMPSGGPGGPPGAGRPGRAPGVPTPDLLRVQDLLRLSRKHAG